jgi:hypothetical protein
MIDFLVLIGVLCCYEYRWTFSGSSTLVVYRFNLWNPLGVIGYVVTAAILFVLAIFASVVSEESFRYLIREITVDSIRPPNKGFRRVKYGEFVRRLWGRSGSL